MTGFKNNRILIYTLMLFAVCIMYPRISLAHAPKDVQLSYDLTSQMLAVTITHKSPFPSFHYIKSVEIKKNGTVVSVTPYENQPDQATFTYSYQVPATAGDTLEVKAGCSLYGNKTVKLTVGK